MSLVGYRRKRHFSHTPEPTGGAAHGDAPILFVVQLHHASHRHYDFRLQVDGVLRSWAVPKGPSFDPGVKRLAMQVEDHPLDYAEFEGTIAPGNYGAGEVRIFDYGTWSTDGSAQRQLGAGHLRFALSGDKLRGEWDLLRTSPRGDPKPKWLLRKRADAEAGPFEADDLLGDPAEPRHPRAVWISSREQAAPSKPAAAPSIDLPGAARETITTAAFAPELARRQALPPRGDEWLHEPKWDGYRLLAAVAGGEVRLWSRNALDWTSRVPEVARAVASLGARALRLDGELVAVSPRRKRLRADFNALQAKLAGEGDASLRYVVFDVLHVEGVDLRGMPLIDRKRVLHALLERARDPILVEGTAQRGDGAALFARALRAGHEGLVSKRPSSRYRPGRVGDWLKVKRHDSEELAVVGYTDPRGSRRGVGALALARPLDGGGWAYAGRVGTGMGARLLAELEPVLRRFARDTAPVSVDSLEVPRKAGDLRGVHWVEPRIAVEVVHHGRGKGGLLRQPSVKAIRYDKAARDLEPGGDRAVAAGDATPPLPAPVVLTHGDRVVYPEVGLTKADVFEYYRKMAPRVLPELARRPMAVVRCTDGVNHEGFFQKHLSRGFGPGVFGAPIRGARGDRQEHLYIEDETGLLSLAQMGVLELHAWGTHVDDTDRADRLVFDLDPAPDLPWSRVVALARTVRQRLERDGLVAFVRTTGGKGLHVVAPIEPTAFDLVKDYAHRLASGLAAERPGAIVDKMAKEARAGRIFLDYLRNARGATTIASYSLRRTPTATVATPLAWDELGRVRDPRRFDLRSTLRARPRDPWSSLASSGRPLPRAR